MNGTLYTTRIELEVNEYSTNFIETLNWFYSELLKGAGSQAASYAARSVVIF